MPPSKIGQSVPENMVQLMNTMITIGKDAIMKGITNGKPGWMVETERFLSFFGKVIIRKDGLSNFTEKVIRPTFEKYSESIMSDLVVTEGEEQKINDDFLRFDTSSKRMRAGFRGMCISFGSSKLPISEAYMTAIKLSEMSESQLPYMGKILQYLYGVFFHGIPEIQDVLENNLKQVAEILEVSDEATQKPNFLSKITDGLKTMGLNPENLMQTLKEVTGGEEFFDKAMKEVKSLTEDGANRDKFLDIMNNSDNLQEMVSKFAEEAQEKIQDLTEKLAQDIPEATTGAVPESTPEELETIPEELETIPEELETIPEES